MNVNTVTVLASVLTMSEQKRESCGACLQSRYVFVAQESFPVSVSDAFAVRRWTTADGLPGNRVTAIEKTSDGYLRVTTSGGTVRFDGVRFSPVGADRIPVPSVEDVSGRSPSAGNRELCRFEEAGGIAWVGTDGERLLQPKALARSPGSRYCPRLHVARRRHFGAALCVSDVFVDGKTFVVKVKDVSEKNVYVKSKPA